MAFENLNHGWGGVRVAPASTTSPIGPESAPCFRNIPRKYTFTAIDTTLAAAAPFSTPWYDTSISGTTFVVALLRNIGGLSTGTSLAFRIDGADNPNEASSIINLTNNSNNNLTGGNFTLQVAVPYRYYRITLLGGAAVSNVRVDVTETNVLNTVTVTGSVFSLVTGSSGAVGNDAANGVGQFSGSTGINYLLGIAEYVATQNPGNNNTAAWFAKRSVAKAKGAQFSANSASVWTPPAGKVVRLMKYKMEVSEDATITSGPLPLNIGFAQTLAGANGLATPASATIGYTHRFVAPAAVLATSGSLYDSNWVDLDNGILLSTAGAALVCGLMVPQTTGAVNPTWTIPSNQWEACTVGFKTTSNLGVFKFVQATSVSNTAGATAIALPAQVTTSGNSLFIFIRTTNIAGGAPTVVVTDTAGNSWTNTALTTNATDGANGSSLLVAYATNITGNAANVVTVTFSVHIPADSIAVGLEYNSAAAGIDAALVGSTGNSTSPASGNYTPSTAGDLVFSFFATAANLGAAPTVGSNFFPRFQIWTAAAGSIAVADNFGNGTLAAGVVNFIGAGTEE